MVRQKIKVHQQPQYDLRAHRATYSTKVTSSPELSRKSVYWFWNTSLSPAPGLAVVSYLGPPYEPRQHGNAKHTSVPYTRQSHSTIDSFRKRHKEKSTSVFQDKVMRAHALKTTPPRAVQQVCDAQYREIKASGLSDCSRHFNAAEVCSTN